MTRDEIDAAVEALAGIADLRRHNNHAGADELLAEHGEEIGDLLDLAGWEPQE